MLPNDKVIVCVCVCVYVGFDTISMFFTDIEGWGISPRGAGYLFGSDVVQQVTISTN